MVFVFIFLILSVPAFAQSADVPLTWDANPVSDNVEIYRMYHSLVAGGPYIEIAQVPIADPLAVPIYTDPAVDFTGGQEHFYVVTALESGFSNELRVKLPQVPGKLKIDRSP